MNHRQRADMGLIMFAWLLFTAACVIYAQRTLFP